MQIHEIAIKYGQGGNILGGDNFGSITVFYDNQVLDYDNSIVSSATETQKLEFMNKWNKLAKYLVMFCELNEEEIKFVRVNKLKIKYLAEDDVYGFMLCGQKQLMHSDGILVLNSPYKSEKFRDDDTSQQSNTVPKELSKLVRELMVGAEEYLNGARLQDKLFKMDKDGGEVKEE